MRNFLKHILKKDSANPLLNEIENPVLSTFTISNATLETNNSCESTFTGTYNIPEGKTATVTGNITIGLEGGSGSIPSGTTNNVQPGTYIYAVNLGNSNIANQASSYVLDITLNTGENKKKLIQRTSFNSVFYDKQPC